MALAGRGRLRFNNHYCISHKDDVANDGTPINPATRTEMNSVLGLLADTANIPATNAALLEFSAYDKLPKIAVNRAFELLNRMATAFARVHSLGSSARPKGVVEAATGFRCWV